MTTSNKDKSKISKTRVIVENVVSLGFALLLVFAIRSSVVEAFKIPSGSMIPTLLIGDHIFVNKFAYGIKIPFSDLVTDSPIYVVKREPPKRGDIIVFMYPKEESLYYIKRVVGVPGDVIEIKGKILHINNQPVNKDNVTGAPAASVFGALEDPKYSPQNLDLYNEHLSGVDHKILMDKNNFMSDNFGPITVPTESLFVMGDNRDFSNDSRYWGFVPFRNVKGKAMIIWLSLWLNFSDSQYYFRPTRTGIILH